MLVHQPGFRLYLWPFKALYLGGGSENGLHRHHAAQVCVSLEESLQFRTSAASSWSSAQAVHILPDCTHQIDAGKAPLLVMYVEPESDEYFALRASLDMSLEERGFIFDLPDRLPPTFGVALHQLIGQGERPDVLWSTCLEQLGIGAPPGSAGRGDARVRTVVDVVRSEPGRSLGVDALARRVHLSPSRLSHLFKHETGVPIRRYVMWARLRAAMAHCARGASLTGAAHAAGCSDAAHLSRTFRQMFGFAPSALFATGVSKNVILVDF